MRKPDFFIIGAPKTGTSSMAEYLRLNPRIFLPEIKEPHFFNTGTGFSRVHSESQYYELFRDAGAQHLAVGEGTVLYLYSDVAVPNILRAIADPKFIVMVRSPIEMAISLHTHLRSEGDEDVGSFEKAWHLQEQRKSGEHVPAFCRDASVLLYGKICSIGWQLKRLYTLVPRERVLVLSHDELKRDARSVYLKTIEFLGVPDDGRTEFAVHNSRRPRVRSQLVQVVLRSLGALNLGTGLGRRSGVFRFIQWLNMDAKKEVLQPDFLAELKNYFRPDLEQLSDLAGRDLSGWLTFDSRTLTNGYAGGEGRKIAGKAAASPFSV